MTDVLTLAGIAFNDFDYSPPERMGAGGKQRMVVHDLPGGSRVIDILGPNEDPIRWSGFFFCNNALDLVLALDALRASGSVVSLQFAGQYRDVVVDHFTYQIVRYPAWIEYDITCTVYQNPSLGNLVPNTSVIDDLVANDLNAAADVPPPYDASGY